jgi:hypothetical protein
MLLELRISFFIKVTGDLGFMSINSRRISHNLQLLVIALLLSTAVFLRNVIPWQLRGFACAFCTV